MRDYGFGEKVWHLIIRQMPKYELVHLVERIKTECHIEDSQILEIIKSEYQDE